MKSLPQSYSSLSALLLVALLAKPCSAQVTTPASAASIDEYATVPVSDPWERVNRVVFRFNDQFYHLVLRPVSKGYRLIVPSPARRRISNVFDNLKFPVRFVSCVLQAKPIRAGREAEKFVLNSTVGVGGLFRPSDKIPALVDLPAEDLGQTLGTWKIGTGPYLVLPFLGPSSLRDTVGFAGDLYLDPVTWAGTRHTVRGYTKTMSYGVRAVRFINFSGDLLDAYDSFRQTAMDPYVSVRDGYLQYRAAAVKK